MAALLLEVQEEDCSAPESRLSSPFPPHRGGIPPLAFHDPTCPESAMNHITFRILPLAALLLALAACGGGEEAASASPDGSGAEPPPVASAPATAAAPATGGGSCATYGFGTPTEKQMRLKPGDRGTLPADFPEPPAGAQLCGSNELDATFFTGGGTAQNAVLEHYRTRLTEQGYTVDATGNGMEQGDLEMSFRKEGAVTGSVYADREGVFSVMYTALR